MIIFERNKENVRRTEKNKRKCNCRSRLRLFFNPSPNLIVREEKKEDEAGEKYKIFLDQERENKQGGEFIKRTCKRKEENEQRTKERRTQKKQRKKPPKPKYMTQIYDNPDEPNEKKLSPYRGIKFSPKISPAIV